MAATNNALSDTIGTRIAEILVAELAHATEREEFGVLVQDVHPLDNSVLTTALAQPKFAKKGRMRLALVDDVDGVSSAIARHSVLEDLLCHEEKIAVGWRNKHLKTIAVITKRPLKRAATFRDFRVIGERDLIGRFCAEQRNQAPVTWLKTLWDALGSDRRLKIGLARIVSYAEGLEAISATDRSANAPRHLYLLGLFPDSHLADETSEPRIQRRLAQNRDLVQDIKRADTEEWNRVRAFVRTLTGKEKTEANKLLRRLKQIPDGSTTEGLDFNLALALWKGRASSKKTNGPGKGGVQRVLVERVVTECLLKEDDARLADISEEMHQIVQKSFEDDDPAGPQVVQCASTSDLVAQVVVDRDILLLAQSQSTEHGWGAIIEIASDKPAALTEVAAFKSVTPFSIAPLRETLARFVEENLAPATALEALEALGSLRSQLVPFVAELALSPIALLAGNPPLLQAAERYLETYESLLRQISGCYGDMHGAADAEAESVVSGLLTLETYVFRREGQFDAIMSPLHPLYIWRNAALVREVRGLATVLAPHEIETVARTSTENTQFLQVLLLPTAATGAEAPMMLGHAGFIGRLPLFREAPRGLLETDGIDTVAELGKRIARLRPYVRAGLQVMLVNAPHPKEFVRAILDNLDLENTSTEETFWGLHIRVRYTQSDTRGWAAEFADLEDAVRDVISSGEEKGLLSISVQPDVISWEKLETELRAEPAHIAVVVDPFEVRSTQVPRAAHLNLTPWMPACEYRFNKLSKEIQVIPVAEEHVFGSYLTTAGLIHTVLQKRTPTHLPQVQKMRAILDSIAGSAIWTVLADPHRVPVPRLGDAEVIDRRVEGARQITCFASDLAPFVSRLDAQLKRTHFVADAETLKGLARDLVAMEPNGILGLATTSHERQVKGSLGKIIAVRWYRMQQPSGLAVSLDTENARRWLVAGKHSEEKADLLGLREEGNTLIIDVLEVKAHDEATPYTVKDDIISGRSVGQLLSTLQALAEVFAPGETSPLARPRREVLREHLYTALLRDKDAGYISRWHEILEDVFAGKMPVKLSGRIVHVQLGSVATKDTATYLTTGRIPITVETLSAEDVGLVLRPDKRDRKSPGTPTGSSTPLARGVKIEEKMDPGAALLSLVKHADEPIAQFDAAGEEEATPDLARPPEPADIIIPKKPSIKPEPGLSSDISGKLSLAVALGAEHASTNVVTWQPGRQSNGFFLILGASGSGKTETLKVLGTPIADAGVPVLVFDFHGDVKLPGVPSVLLSSGSASTLGLNPMELDITSAEESGLYDQRAALRNMLQRAVPALGHRQSSILREAFDEAYTRAGIKDNDPNTWGNAAPTFALVQQILFDWSQDDQRRSQRTAIEGCIAAVQELFDHPIFQRTEHITVDEMLSHSVRLDLSKLPDQIRFVATETLLRKLFRILKLRGPIPVQPADDRERFRLFVIIDEAKILSLGGGDRDRSDNILNELITEARKFGLGMILASQMSEHFSEEVRANAATWLVLKPMDIREAKKNAPNVSVDPEDLIRLAGRGDGYYRDRPSSRARRIQIKSITG